MSIENTKSELSENKEKNIVLPDRTRMEKILEGITLPNRLLQSKLYPLLLQEAGKEFSASGIALVILHAVNKFIAELYKGDKNMTSLEAQAVLGNEVPKIIDALVNNPEAASQVINEINEAIPHLSSLFPPKQSRF